MPKRTPLVTISGKFVDAFGWMYGSLWKVRTGWWPNALGCTCFVSSVSLYVLLCVAPGARPSIPRKLRTCCFVAVSRNIFWMYNSNAALLCSNTFAWKFLTLFAGNGARSELFFFSVRCSALNSLYLLSMKYREPLLGSNTSTQ